MTEPDNLPPGLAYKFYQCPVVLKLENLPKPRLIGEQCSNSNPLCQWSSVFDDMFYQIKAYEAALKKLETPSVIAPANPSGSSEPSIKVKLPVLAIPSFEGDPTTFQTWKGLFDQLIHSNDQLSDIEKFSYLKSFLKGPALACVDHVPFVGANYPLAYRTINESSVANLAEREIRTGLFKFPNFEKNFRTFKICSFLAQRVVQQLVSDEGDNFPRAAQVIASSIYVDDVVTGADSVQTACALKEELTSLMGKGGFELRKWASSHLEVLADLPGDMCESVHSLGDTDSLKVLGAQWSPSSDSFFYSVKPGEMSNLTKRKILSVIASTYDPNGFLSPVTVWLKIFMQQIWLNKDLSWDTVLPKPLQEKWMSFMTEIQLIENIQIPRYVLKDNIKSIELIGFADGSAVAYSAVVYLRTVDGEGIVHTHLIRAKTKVSPLKVLTINKIELCAALLLARVIKSLSFLVEQLNISNIYLFSDSTTVLSWLTVQPHLLKTFVANRVVEILELTKCVSWQHVSSQENSADPASRGILPSELINNSLWFEGPSFLKKDPQEWPQRSIQSQEITELKTKPQVCLTAQVESDNVILTLIERFSSLGKLQRVLGY
ncbi:hypothetical protein WDU94_002724 [Cyamophila willieti]